MTGMEENRDENNPTTALLVDRTFYENAANLILESRKIVASTANTVICVTNFEHFTGAFS